jgi:hypothetical protein
MISITGNVQLHDVVFFLVEIKILEKIKKSFSAWRWVA